MESKVAGVKVETSEVRAKKRKFKHIDETVAEAVKGAVEEPTFASRTTMGERNSHALQSHISKLEALPRFTHKKRLFRTFTEVFDVVSPEGEEGMAVIEEFITGHIRPKFRLRESVTLRLTKAVRDFREIRRKDALQVAGLNRAWIDCLVENGLIAPED